MTNSPQLQRSAPKRQWLVLLLMLDALFTSLQISRSFFNLSDQYYFLYNELSHIDNYIFIKIIICLAALATILLFKTHTSRMVVASWLVIFILLAFDSWFGLHVTLGLRASTLLSLAGEHSAATGEMAVFISVGLLAGCITLFSTVISEKSDWLFTASLYVLLALLAVFGVVIDYIHAILTYHAAAPLLEVFEVSGELFTWTLVVWFMLLCSKMNSAPSLYQLTGNARFR